MIDPDGCADSLELQWRHLRFNSSVLIKGDEKYEIQEKKTDTKCKIEFILTIKTSLKMTRRSTAVTQSVEWVLDSYSRPPLS